MSALLYVAEGATVEATPDTMTLRFKSGDDTIALILTRHAAMTTKRRMSATEWVFQCAPDGDVVSLPKRKSAVRKA
jgi:hypothetical protein